MKGSLIPGYARREVEGGERKGRGRTRDDVAVHEQRERVATEGIRKKRTVLKSIEP